jgi:serine phosphatase RsbU (regulator of sigma subunit)
VSIEGTLCGRVFTTTQPMWVDVDDGARLLLPIQDGVERIGVLALDLAAKDPSFEEPASAFAVVVGGLLLTKSSYGDEVEITRRAQEMTIAAEIQWGLLPPPTFGTERVVISGSLEPAYEIGGDAYDYALNGDILHFALLDGVGHGLRAASLAAVAMATYRNSRRSRRHLLAAARAIDVVVADLDDPELFVTGWLGELDTATGQLIFLNAGHPRPLLMRHGHAVKEIGDEPQLPFGFGDPYTSASTEALEPGDHLLIYTDGVVEARDAQGEFFGEERLVDFIERASASGFPVPEILRRLTAAVLLHQEGALQDDSSLVLAGWLGKA